MTVFISMTRDFIGMKTVVIIHELGLCDNEDGHHKKELECTRVTALKITKNYGNFFIRTSIIGNLVLLLL